MGTFDYKLVFELFGNNHMVYCYAQLQFLVIVAQLLEALAKIVDFQLQQANVF